MKLSALGFWLILAWLCLVFAPQADSAEAPQLIFEQISVAQGLSQSIVTNIMQDHRGLLWFGTEDGLDLYNGYGFTVLRTDPADPLSLSYNQITALYEDRNGGIWAGTFNGGLNRYILANNTFIRYRSNPSDSTSLSNDLVYCIVQDQAGRIWIGTDNGLNRMIPAPDPNQSATFVRFFHDPSIPYSLSDSHVRAMAVDSSGNLWIGTDQGLNLLEREQGDQAHPRFIHLSSKNVGERNLAQVMLRRSVTATHNDKEWNNLAHDTVRTLLVDRSGALWIGAVHGLHCLRWNNGQTLFKSFFHHPTRPHTLSNNHIYALLEDSDGFLWIGTDGGGLNRFDPATGEFATWRNNPLNPNSLSHDEIRSLFQDRSGLLWVGTYGGGASKVDARRKRFIHYQYDPNRPEGLSQPIIWSIYEDRDSLLWIGTHGGGLDKLDRRHNRYTHYRADADDPHSLSHNIVRLVIPGHHGELWIGTHGGGICRLNPRSGRFQRYLHDPADPRSLIHNEIRSLFLDSDSVLWIGTQGGGLDQLNTAKLNAAGGGFHHLRHNPADSNTVSSNYIRFVFKDRDGFYWIGTQGGGLDRLDKASGEFIHFRHNPTNPNSISSDYIFSIHEDHLGLLWLGTWGAGLIKFDRAGSRFTTYSTKDGLPSDAVYAILEDKNGKLWCSTNNGIFRFDPVTAQCKNYNIRDGLQSNEFNGGSAFKSPSGEMFFGGINGFNSFTPEQIQDKTYIPPIVLTAFRKMNRTVQLNQPLSEIKALTLSHRDYLFSFEFAALDYTAPEKNHYAYKLEGLDEEWIATSANNRQAQYTTLPAGDYVFRVKGSNNDGIWNETGVAVAITITPPYWQTWPFRILGLLTLCGAGLWLYLRRLRLIRMQAELRAAHDMQMAIMPQADPQVPGFDISGICIPANQVGGDFFDYTWVGHQKQKFAIIIGDVSGKAMRAAMTAVMANGILYSEAAGGSQVNETVTRGNHLLYPKIDRQTFVALCVVALNLHPREMRFTNAGLNEPLLWSEGKWRPLRSNGASYPIGIIDHHVYQEQRIELKPGDMLILQTDGVADAMNKNREFYGEERLLAFLNHLDGAGCSSRQIRDALLADVQTFTGQAQRYDDMTVIVVKVLP